jgi:glutamate:Na+ symporter, ESS family
LPPVAVVTVSVVTVPLDAIQVLALGCLGLVLGHWIKQLLPVLDDLNIPGPIVGGLVYAVLVLILRDRWANFTVDATLQRVLMVAFFTTIGMSASLGLVKKGGPQVLWFLILATIGALFQNVLGVASAQMFGLNPLLGIISGSVALTGGPATALSFGATFEQDFGVAGARTLGVSAAMFGITAGGLIGGFMGGRFIRQYKLRPFPQGPMPTPEQILYSSDSPSPEPSRIADESESEESALLRNTILVAIAMGLGSLIGLWFAQRKIVLPEYIGAMIAAAVIRNIDDRKRCFGLSQRHMDTIGNIALSIFIVMAMLGLRLWELAQLAVPMIAMLFMQVLLIAIMCFGVFRLMGRDYEAAVMSGGFCGFMLGTTANAMACMTVLRDKYGPAPRAFIVVPLVGASLIDFTNATIINMMANFFR